MSTIQEYISVIGFFQGVLLFALLVGDKRMKSASRILGVMCLCIAFVFLVPIIIVHAQNNAVSWIIGPVFFFPAALGPLGYLYCRNALLDTPLVKRDLVHLLPWLLCYIITADVSLADPQAMVRWITGTSPTGLRLQISEYIPAVVALAYAGWTGLIIWRYRRHANNNVANFDPSAFRWLLTLQAFGLIVWFLKTLPSFDSMPRLFPDIANLILVVLVYIIAIKQWRNPQFFTIPNLSEVEKPAATEPTSSDLMLQDGELDPAIRADLFETVKSQLEARKLYLDDQLTLSSLATATGLSKHHLSEVLNRHARKNFYKFINEYRIDFVRKRFEAGTDQTILEIALDAGFSSKSTFNAIFKQFTGQTPTQYRKNLAA